MKTAQKFLKQENFLDADSNSLNLDVPKHVTNNAGSVMSILWVDHEGYILDSCEVFLKIFGYPRNELKGRHVSMLLPSLLETKLITDGTINANLAFRCQCGTFRIVAHDGSECTCTLFVNHISDSTLKIIVLPKG